MPEITKRNPLLSEAQELTRAHAEDTLHARRTFNRLLLSGLFLGGSRFARAEDSQEPVLAASHRQFVIGGGGTLPEKVHLEFIRRAGGDKADIGIVSSAHKSADDDHEVESWWKWKDRVRSAEVIHTRDREVANSEEFVGKVKGKTGMWFTGGEQADLVKSYLHTKFLEELKKRSEDDVVIGATSAGASALSALMIERGEVTPELSEGFGFVPWIIDQHQDRPGRPERFFVVAKKNPDQLCVGIEGRTALILDCTADRVIGTVMGEGNVRFRLGQDKQRVVTDGQTIDLADFGKSMLRTDNEQSTLLK